MTELLPCPFCGVTPVIEETLGDRRPWFGVVCRSGKNVGGTCAIESRPTATRETAAKRWNTRAPQQGERKLVEALGLIACRPLGGKTEDYFCAKSLQDIAQAALKSYQEGKL